MNLWLRNERTLTKTKPNLKQRNMGENFAVYMTERDNIPYYI